MNQDHLARAAARLLAEQLRTARPERSLRRDVDVIEALGREIGRRPRRRWRRLSVELGFLAAAALILVAGVVGRGPQVVGIAPAAALVRGGVQAAGVGLATVRRQLVRTADARVEVLGILSRITAGARLGSPARPRVAAAVSNDEPSSLAEQNDLFARAMLQERQGEVAGALATLRELVTRFPRGPLATSARAEMERMARAR